MIKVIDYTPTNENSSVLERLLFALSNPKLLATLKLKTDDHLCSAQTKGVATAPSIEMLFQVFKLNFS